MITSTPTSGQVAVCLIIFVGYYWLIKRLFGVISERVAGRIPGGSRLSTRDLYSVLKTGLGVASQATLIVVVMILVPQTRFQRDRVVVGLLWTPAGLILGIAEMAASIMVAQYLLRLLNYFGVLTKRSSLQITPETWVDISRGGWMGSVTAIRRDLPKAVGISIIWLQVACEEIMFRQCFPGILGGDSGQWISALLFVVMQVFGMPSWRSALFPVIGAIIMAAAHAQIAIGSGLILPLIVAHATSFFAASRIRRG